MPHRFVDTYTIESVTARDNSVPLFDPERTFETGSGLEGVLRDLYVLSSWEKRKLHFELGSVAHP